jgi:hypothetical protein
MYCYINKENKNAVGNQNILLVLLQMKMLQQVEVRRWEGYLVYLWILQEFLSKMLFLNSFFYGKNKRWDFLLFWGAIVSRLTQW